MNGLAMYAYVQDHTPDELVEEYAPLVKRIGHHLMGRLPDTVQLDDLLQAGMIGLLEAARNFDHGHGASFETYAGIRIRGAMLDEVRRHDWTPRSVHRKARQVAAAVRSIERRTGRDARDVDIAAELDLPLAEYHRLLRDANGQKLFSFDELGFGDDSALDSVAGTEPGILDTLQLDDLQRKLADNIATLPEREQLVMSLYYDQELNLKEVGAVLGVS